MAHTPTPWIVRNTGRPGVWKAAGASFVKVATVESPDAIPALSDEKRRHNAEFIVRAVNSHDHLLQAAEESLERLKRLAETYREFPATHTLLTMEIIRLGGAVDHAKGKEGF